MAVTLTSLTLNAQVLGNRNTFDNSIILSIDTILNSPGDSNVGPDGFAGLQRLGLSDFQIRTLVAQSEEWFFERFGYDFTKVKADASGMKVLNGVMEMPFHIAENAPYRAVMLKDGLKKNLDITDAGIGFMVIGEGAMWYGSYGGAMGVPAMMDEGVGMGYYAIPGAAKDGGTLMLKYRADTPMQMVMSGAMTIQCIIESDELGNGYEMGLGVMQMTADGKYHLMYRNVITFPDSTVGDMDMPMMMKPTSRATRPIR